MLLVYVATVLKSKVWPATAFSKIQVLETPEVGKLPVKSQGCRGATDEVLMA